MKDKILMMFCTFCFTYGLSQTRIQSGHTYVDENGNGIYDIQEELLSQISISNGVEIVQSNERGEYELALREEGVIFVIKPSGYLPALSEENISKFYSYYRPEGSPKYKFVGIPKTILPDQLDFAFYPNPGESQLRVALLGDTQVEKIAHVFHVAKLVAEQLVDEKVDFVVPLGDLVFDDLNLFDPLKKVLGKIGAPVYYVYGNHDRNYDASELQYRDETYNAHFGPSHYAFNYGDNAFLVLNTVFPENGTRNFEGKIDEDQIQFIDNYIRTIPNETAIHIFMHIPLEQISNLKTLLELFKTHPNVFAYAGHTHTQYFKNFTTSDGWSHEKPLKELVAGAVCGAWWLGEKDMYGVPNAMMGDGTPKGFWIVDIDGSNRKCFYKPSGDFSNKQMHIWTPNEFKEEKPFLDQDEIIVNIFAGDDSTEVKIKINDKDWVPMQKVLEPDPYYTMQIKLQEQKGKDTDKIPFYREKFPISQHVWKIKIPIDLTPGIYNLEVRAKNNNGLDTGSEALLFMK